MLSHNSVISLPSHAAIEEIKEKMKMVKHKILVLSGKGGVGKSTFSAHLAHGLAEDETKQVGVPEGVCVCMLESSGQLHGEKEKKLLPPLPHPPPPIAAVISVQNSAAKSTVTTQIM